MITSPNPHRGFCYPAEVIEHAVWLYHRFSLSLRDVELILAARGVVVSYESICNGIVNLWPRQPQPDDFASSIKGGAILILWITQTIDQVSR